MLLSSAIVLGWGTVAWGLGHYLQMTQANAGKVVLWKASGIFLIVTALLLETS